MRAGAAARRPCGGGEGPGDQLLEGAERVAERLLEVARRRGRELLALVAGGQRERHAGEAAAPLRRLARVPLLRERAARVLEAALELGALLRGPGRLPPTPLGRGEPAGGGPGLGGLP